MAGEPGRQPTLGHMHKSKAPTKTKSQRKDDSIMGTNNSSIVSKRSVERVYFPNEPHFFRYFVKKPQRRSPLINRGYWLRMKALDQVVHHFLEQPSEINKVVINLGCGYDPLPWQCLSRYKSACQGTIFIDVDYHDLMLKKRSVVQSTPELNTMLTNLEIGEGDILLRSDQYVQVSCDLRDLAGLNRALAKVVDVEKCMVLVTAEVSITYMHVDAANALIEWAGRLPRGRFCLLEQIIPDGIDQPFSEAMMSHFDKIQTPLGAVRRYPTTQAQKTRFRELGWPCISVCNLWELWSLEGFVTPAHREYLDSLEPFDEWEEFALFGCHYFLLVADTSNSSPYPSFGTTPKDFMDPQPLNPSAETQFAVDFTEYPKAQGCRRFAAAISVKDPEGRAELFGVFGGMGLESRTNTYDVYVNRASIKTPRITKGPVAIPSPRMCHTITDLGESGSFLVGGRTSPDQGFMDCWIYHKWLGIWEQVNDLPYPLYRHQAIDIGSGNVLLSTGRMDSHKLSNDYLVWCRSRGWRKCIRIGEVPPSTYGSVFAALDEETSDNTAQPRIGILAGGISGDARMQEDVWQWTVTGLSSENPTISFAKSNKLKNSSSTLSRFGASTIKFEGRVYLIGGIIKDHMLPFDNEICIIDTRNGILKPVSLVLEQDIHRPLLIGTTTVAIGGSLVITGGSAVCFSFGTFWNNGCYTLKAFGEKSPEQESSKVFHNPTNTWRYSHTISRSAAAARSLSESSTLPVATSLDVVSLPRVQITTSEDFKQIIETGKPVILEKLNIGSCVEKWSPDYLKAQVGTDREVVVHKATEEYMNFKAKNFKYTTENFGDFMDQVQEGKRLYLRALSLAKPSEFPADLATDWPTVAPDFQLPPELAFVIQNAHSCPLRVSGPVTMWLHYDVMANVLCQVQGTKRLLLFPPSDVRYFEFEAGASSSHIKVFERLQEPAFANTHPHEAHLQPGDILFIPPLWLHTASPTAGVSVAVNVFFRNLQAGYAVGKDVYGNRDLQAYAKGRQDVAKIARSFSNLPADVREFYLQRLADELAQKAS